MSSLFWCAGSWNLTGKNLAKLRATQQAMVHKMLAPKRESYEDLAVFLVRVARTRKQLMNKHNFQSFDAIFHRLVFEWGGHVYRMSSYDPQRWTHQVLLLTNWSWIQLIASQNSGSQLHCRMLKVWRWERPLYKFFLGHNKYSCWEEAAADKHVWKSLVPEFVAWRLINR